jgi:hypothetical protein
MKGVKSLPRYCPPSVGAPTECNLRSSYAAAVASTSAGKAEPNLTEVIFTSAPKPSAVRRVGAPIFAPNGS